MERTTEPRFVLFDPTPEIFATDGSGSFTHQLTAGERPDLETSRFDEVRFLFSVWHPSTQKSIDLDRAYVELRALLNPAEDHWMKVAEIEPVVPAYGGGESFDGWIVLPVMALQSSWSLFGSGFEPRSRLQVRASAYLVP